MIKNEFISGMQRWFMENKCDILNEQNEKLYCRKYRESCNNIGYQLMVTTVNKLEIIKAAQEKQIPLSFSVTKLKLVKDRRTLPSLQQTLGKA